MFIIEVVCSQPGRVVFHEAPWQVLAAMIRFVRTGSWFPVFWLIIALDAVTALLALLVLKPLRANFLRG